MSTSAPIAAAATDAAAARRDGPATRSDAAASGAAARSPAGRWQALASSRAWRLAGAAFMAALALAIAALLVHSARQVDWPAVAHALAQLPPATLALAALLAWSGHLAYGCFDLFGRHLVRHTLSVPRTMAVTLIAYPFTLNLGSFVGGAPVRWRLYSRQGLGVGQIAQIVVISAVTNWVGYCALAGAVFWHWTPQLPAAWQPGALHLRWLGALLATLSVLHVLLCAWRGGRPLALRGRRLPLPNGRVALLQVLASVASWSLMGAAVWVLAQGQAPYPAALATVLLGAVAGIVSRIPAGLGVLEAVGTAVLSRHLPVSAALAVMLALRALYYLAPLAAAALALLAAELLWRRRTPPDAAGA